MESVADKVLKRIQRKGRGFAFSGKDFLDLATRPSVDKALSALVQSGQIRRLVRGVYDYPRVNEKLGGELSPDYDQVAHAIARSTATRIEPSGNWAANLLGLTTQVPGKIVYRTNGTSRTYRIGGQTIAFQRAAPKELRAKSPIASIVISALRSLGRNRVDDKIIEHLRHRLSSPERKVLLRDARYSEDWILEAVKKITTEKQGTDG